MGPDTVGTVLDSFFRERVTAAAVPEGVEGAVTEEAVYMLQALMTGVIGT